MGEKLAVLDASVLSDSELLEVKTVFGWMAFGDIERVKSAIASNTFGIDTYRKLKSEYVPEEADNGGFSPRDQYVLWVGSPWRGTWSCPDSFWKEAV